MYKIIHRSKSWVLISTILVVLSLVLTSIWGLKVGIDFTGGSMMEIAFNGEKPSSMEVSDSLEDLELGSLSVQPSENGFILRFQDSGEESHRKTATALRDLSASKNGEVLEGNFEELSFTSIGPSIGRELQRKALVSIILVLIVVSGYIAIVFRKVSKPVESWKYGIATLLALFHDVLIVIAIYSILGKFWGVEVNSSFVVAILSVMGFSVHDTIVVLIVFVRIYQRVILASEKL